MMLEVASEEDKGVQALLPCLCHHMRHRSRGDRVRRDAGHQHAQPRARSLSPLERLPWNSCTYFRFSQSFFPFIFFSH